MSVLSPRLLVTWEAYRFHGPSLEVTFWTSISPTPFAVIQKKSNFYMVCNQGRESTKSTRALYINIEKQMCSQIFKLKGFNKSWTSSSQGLQTGSGKAEGTRTSHQIKSPTILLRECENTWGIEKKLPYLIQMSNLCMQHWRLPSGVTNTGDCQWLPEQDILQ